MASANPKRRVKRSKTSPAARGPERLHLVVSRDGGLIAAFKRKDLANRALAWLRKHNQHFPEDVYWVDTIKRGTVQPGHWNRWLRQAEAQAGMWNRRLGRRETRNSAVRMPRRRPRRNARRDEGITPLLIEWGAVPNEEHPRGGWVPGLWVNDVYEGNTYSGSVIEKPQAEAEAKARAYDMRDRYTGDTPVKVRKRKGDFHVRASWAQNRRKYYPKHNPKRTRKRGAKRRRNPGVDEHAVRELVLYIENDGGMYQSLVQPTQKALVTKMARGTYEHDKAITQWKRVADQGAKEYTREHGSFGGPRWSNAFSVATRKRAAEIMADAFRKEARSGEYNYLLPKKYQKRSNPRRLRSVTIFAVLRRRGTPEREVDRVHVATIDPSRMPENIRQSEVDKRARSYAREVMPQYRHQGFNQMLLVWDNPRGDMKQRSETLQIPAKGRINPKRTQKRNVPFRADATKPRGGSWWRLVIVRDNGRNSVRVGKGAEKDAKAEARLIAKETGVSKTMLEGPFKRKPGRKVKAL